jgi:hypothetical protein
MVIKKMKKNNKDRLPDNSEAIKQERVTSKKKIKKGGANAIFPQEYEEQRSMDIRMKPQPFVNDND